MQTATACAIDWQLLTDAVSGSRSAAGDCECLFTFHLLAFFCPFRLHILQLKVLYYPKEGKNGTGTSTQT
jgi:hypothetical protein